MDEQQFDRLTKRLAHSLKRRRLVTHGIATGIASVTSLASLRGKGMSIPETSAATPKLTLKTASAPVGSTISLTLSGFSSNASVDIRWFDGNSASDASRVLKNVRITSSSTKATVSIPKSAVLGKHRIEARLRTSRSTSTGPSVTFTVTAHELRNVEQRSDWAAEYCEYFTCEDCKHKIDCSQIPHDPPTLSSTVGSNSRRLTHFGGPRSYANILYGTQIRTNEESTFPYANHFSLSFLFQYRPKMPFDNAGNIFTSLQAIEFGVRFYLETGILWDWEIQWNLIPTGNGNNPVWKVLLNGSWATIGRTTNLTLSAAKWHRVTFNGSIRKDQLYYKDLTIDGTTQVLDLYGSKQGHDHKETVLSAITQLDGPDSRANENVEVFLDDMTLSWWRTL